MLSLGTQSGDVSAQSNLNLGGGVSAGGAALSVSTAELAPPPAASVSMRSTATLGGGHDGASTIGTAMESWLVGLTAPDPRGGKSSRDTLVARIRDLELNDPMGRSAIETRIDNVVGTGWRLSSKVDHRMLGVSFEAAEPLCEQIEAYWESYTGDPLCRFTPSERLTWNQLEALSYRIFYRDGESFGLITYDDDGGRALFGTRLQLIDPDRVSNPKGLPDKPHLKNGIELDAEGRPVAAHILEAHPSELFLGSPSRTWRRVPFFDDFGRPVLIHAATTLRPDQLRGVSRLAPVIKALRSLNVFDDAELQSRVVNALFAAVLTTNWDPREAAEAIDPASAAAFDAARAEHYRQNPVKNPFGGRISVLPAGDQLQALDTKRDTGEGFVTRVLHNIAAGGGLTYSQLTGDLSKVNYSSIRAGLLEIYRNFSRDQESFAGAFWSPFLYAILEEGFVRGYFSPPPGAPDFHTIPAAYCRVRWVKPGRGYIDEVKEVQAAAIRMRVGITTLEDECARYDGSDWREKMRQQKRERALRVELGLPVIPFADAVRANAATDKGEGGAAADDEFNDPANDPDSEDPGDPQTPKKGTST